MHSKVHYPILPLQYRFQPAYGTYAVQQIGDLVDAEMKQAIGKRVRAWRELRGYTREQLSSLSALSPRFIANIEDGDTGISLETLIALCRALSCSSDSILLGDEIQPEAWDGDIARLQSIPIKYQPQISRLLQSTVELLLEAGANEK